MSEGKGLKILIMGMALAAAVFFLVSLGIYSGRKGLVNKPGKIARVDIIGPIISSTDAVEAIKKSRDDREVAAILVRIDSPGGGVSPSQEIYRELLKTREKGKQKVVVSIGNLGASGGYYIASAADRIYANPGSLVGSIGVILELTKFSELLKKVGVENEVIKSGPYKDIGSPFRKTSDDERQILQGVIDDTLRQFTQAVAEGRKMDPRKVATLADGRIFTGAQAKDLGMVDELGGFEDALEGAARMAKIEGKPVVVKPQRKWGWRYFLDSAASVFTRNLHFGDFPGLMYLWQP